jgi:membrane protease YdiL (CAAX protease family)
MLIAFTIAAFFLYANVSAVLWQMLSGRPVAEMAEGLGNPAYTNITRFLQTIYAFVGFFLPALVTASLLNRHPWRLLGYSQFVTGRQVGLVIAITALAIIVASWLNYLNYQITLPAEWKIKFDKMEADYSRQTQAIMVLRSPMDFIMSLLVMGFVPALCEETLFRGGLQNFLYRSTGNSWLAIIVVSIIFSIVHFSFYGFLFRVLLGFILGWIYHYSGKIWLNVLAHFLNNALVIAVYFNYIRDGKKFEDVPDLASASLWVIPAIPLLIFLLLAFKRISFNTKTE